jgi:hypothetical protein
MQRKETHPAQREEISLREEEWKGEKREGEKEGREWKMHGRTDTLLT